MKIRTKESSSKFLQELKDRGLFFDCTNEEKLILNLESGKKVYFGIDPTGPSLHLGHYLGLTLLERFLRFGINVVILLGDITALIGDPSGKKYERIMMKTEDIERNVRNIRKQIERYFSNIEGINDENLRKNYQIICNSSFYKEDIKGRYIDVFYFLKNIGRFVNVTSLLGKKFLDERLSRGLTFTELSYPIFQGYDFYQLYDKHSVFVQIGGQDQWGNIVTGIDLIRRVMGKEVDAVGLTFPLLLDDKNKKFGKSEDNAFFLDETLTKPYDLSQYLINLSDNSSEKYLKSLTFLSIQDIEEIVKKHEKDKTKKYLQRRLSEELLSRIYDPKTSQKIKFISDKLFFNIEQLNYEDCCEIEKFIPCFCQELKDVEDDLSIKDVIKKLSFSDSNSESNRLISEKCIYLLDSAVKKFVPILDSYFLFFKNLDISLSKDGIFYFLIRKGRKDYGLVKIIR